MNNETTNPTFTIIPVADDLNKHSATLQAAETLHRSLRPNLPDDYAGYMRKMFSEGAGMAVLMVGAKRSRSPCIGHFTPPSKGTASISMILLQMPPSEAVVTDTASLHGAKRKPTASISASASPFLLSAS